MRNPGGRGLHPWMLAKINNIRGEVLSKQKLNCVMLSNRVNAESAIYYIPPNKAYTSSVGAKVGSKYSSSERRSAQWEIQFSLQRARRAFLSALA